MVGDGALVGHPEDCAVRAFAGETQHDRPQCGDEDGQRGHRPDVERVVDVEGGVLDVDRTGGCACRVEDVEIVAGKAGRLLVRQAEHVADHPVV